tara:strand:- start:674 stop:958 length:285 start_codon:yes stop_codon:yes gene_type:complete
MYEIIYLTVYSLVCFLVIRKYYNIEMNKLKNFYQKNVEDLENKFKELSIKQDKTFISAKYEVSKENKLYLSRMNKDISAKIKELADIVKNRPII